MPLALTMPVLLAHLTLAARTRRSAPGGAEPAYDDNLTSFSGEDPADAWEYMGRKGQGRLGLAAQRCTKRLLPTFLYIGMGHAGSTTFANDLALHPKLSYGQTKEHRCLTSFWPKTCSSKEAAGIGQYRKQFQVGCDIEHSFDATPETAYIGSPHWPKQYLGLLQGSGGITAVESLRDLLGSSLKFVMLIRDPVDWLKSRFSQKAVLNKNKWWFTCHADTLKSWFQVFPRENFLFIRSEDYFADRMAVLNRTFKFIGADPELYVHKDQLPNPSGRRRTRVKLSDETRRTFHRHEDNLRCKNDLEQLIGMKFHWLHSNDSSVL
mmetsp:Transcript_115396/g.304867  ORF Transcript_115396/g.304867 Transcript_115396/m.304867 type:complete len:322 (-) Transcript_115396:188-1153(-)